MKTWIDLLGRNTNYVHVDGNRIVRDDPETDYPQRKVTILWTFDTEKQAEENFQAWLREVIAPPPGSWASVAVLMAQTSPVEDDPDFWDRWKDEMKERDM